MKAPVAAQAPANPPMPVPARRARRSVAVAGAEQGHGADPGTRSLSVSAPVDGRHAVEWGAKESIRAFFRPIRYWSCDTRRSAPYTHPYFSSTRSGLDEGGHAKDRGVVERVVFQVPIGTLRHAHEVIYQESRQARAGVVGLARLGGGPASGAGENRAS